MAVTTDQIDNRVIALSTKPASKAFTITPNATNYLADASDNPIYTRAILLPEDGTVNVVMADDSISGAIVLTLKGGIVYPLAIKMLLVTSTTPATIIGFR